MLHLGGPKLIFGLSTLNSHSGTLLHIGQIFFLESWNDQVFKTSPYNQNTISRTLNSQDRFLTGASRNGYSPFARYVWFVASGSEIKHVSI